MLVVKVPWPARGGGIILGIRGGTGIAYSGAVVWTQFYSKAHTEKLGVRSDAAPASDGPGLFVGPATNPELAQIARQTASRGVLQRARQPN